MNESQAAACWTQAKIPRGLTDFEVSEKKSKETNRFQISGKTKHVIVWIIVTTIVKHNVHDERS